MSFELKRRSDGLFFAADMKKVRNDALEEAAKTAESVIKSSPENAWSPWFNAAKEIAARIRQLKAEEPK